MPLGVPDEANVEIVKKKTNQPASPFSEKNETQFQCATGNDAVSSHSSIRKWQNSSRWRERADVRLEIAQEDTVKRTLSAVIATARPVN
jgi:hypothetical protein